MNGVLYGDLAVIGTRGCEQFLEKVDMYLKEWRHTDHSFVVNAECKRFGSGEAKAMIPDSLRGYDVYIIADVFNHGVTYRMYNKEFAMDPDDHFQDLKRIINAIAGKARRVSVIMPMLYESRQDKRHVRESLDCAIALQELVNMGVSNILTFDVHNIGVQNAIPLHGFDNIQCYYQMLKALVKSEPNIVLDKDNFIVISPDEGAMQRCMYYSSVLGCDLGMFYKRRDYTTVINGKNPIVAHEYLGRSLEGKDVIIVDDIISSGESMLDVARQLRDRGAKNVYIFATFGLFCDGLDKIDAAYEAGWFTRIFTTNLVYRTPELLSRDWYREVSLNKYVALIIDTLNHDESIYHVLNPGERIKTLLAKHEEDLKAKGIL